MNYKLGRVLALISLFFNWGTAQAYAAGLCPDNPQFSNLCDINETSIQNVPGQIVTILLILAIILALIYLVYGGIKWITSGGDKAKVDAARSHITAAVIGLVLALMAYLVLNLILYIFTGQAVRTFTIPRLF
jgi:amino acid transporter